MKYDSVHGRFANDVKAIDDDTMQVNGKEIQVYSERDPSDLPWNTLEIDIVFECSGVFTKRDACQKHIDAGAKRVLISAPGTDEDLTVVYGVNHDQLTGEHIIVSNASCTTNCLAPVAKTLNDAIGIEQGFMTTIHAYTGDQRVTDTAHKDLHRARAAAANLIPTSTGAAKAVGKVLPELNGKLDGVAIRVPTPNVSLVDLKFNASRETSVDEVNKAIQAAADGALKDILGYYDEALVSTDFNHDSRSSIFSLAGTKVMDGTLVRIMTWYDNEWGFSNRMLDTAAIMGKFL
jgi:glyceraldehyde 3-phosphate dehydrogenase